MSKVFNTRLQLKYDLWKNWSDNNPILLAGEIAVVYIPEETDATTGKVIQKPATMFKVGDGVSSFNSLDWASGLAADVYAWAKEASIPVVKEGNGNVIASIDWDATANNGKGGLKYTTASVATSEGLAALQNALNELTTKVNGMYTNEQIDTAIATAKTGAETTAANALSAAKTELTTEINKKVDKVEGHSLVSDAEITRLSGVHNYDDTQIKADIAKKADSATMVTELGKKVDKVTGYSLVSDTEIARLAAVDNYNDEEVRGLIKDNADDIAEIAGDYVKAADIANFETKANVQAVADARYTKAEADAKFALKDNAYNDSEVRELIQNNADAIAAEAERATAAEAKALEDAKAYADEIKSDLLGDDLTTTFDTLKAVQDWVDTHGEQATELATALANETKAREEADTGFETRVKALEEAAPTHATKDEVATAKQGAIDAAAADATTKANAAQAAAEATAAADATTKANAAETNAKAYTDAEIVKVNTEVAKKANSADLHTVATTGNIKDLAQTENEYVIFYCGNASTMVGTDADAIPAPSAE